MVPLLGGVDAIITAGAVVGADGEILTPKYTGTPLLWAAKAVSDGVDARSGLQLATLLIDMGAEVNAVGHGDIYDRDGASDRELLANVDGVTPLYWAARAMFYGKAEGLELVRLLIEKGADVDGEGFFNCLCFILSSVEASSLTTTAESTTLIAACTTSSEAKYCCEHGMSPSSTWLHEMKPALSRKPRCGWRRGACRCLRSRPRSSPC